VMQHVAGIIDHRFTEVTEGAEALLEFVDGLLVGDIAQRLRIAAGELLHSRALSS